MALNTWNLHMKVNKRSLITFSEAILHYELFVLVFKAKEGDGIAQSTACLLVDPPPPS